MTTAAIRTRPTSSVSLHVGAPGPGVATEAAELLNGSLGAGFVRPSDLAELTGDAGVLIRARGRRGQLLGAATARVLEQETLNSLQGRLHRAGVEAGLDGYRVGELKSAAVAPGARGRGIGSDMVRARLTFLQARGCTLVVCASWVSGGPSSRGLLEAAGFEPVATIPGYWAEDQKAAGYLCADCGAECTCEALILVCRLED